MRLKNKDYVFSSNFKEDICLLLKEKEVVLAVKSVDIYRDILKHFDIWVQQHYPNANILTKEIVSDWLKLRKTTQYQKEESAKYRQLRSLVMRALCTNITLRGKEAYVIPKGRYKAKGQRKPFIYTKKEINRFIAAVESLDYDRRYPHQKLMIPLMFKLYICCGFRISELLNLKVKDVLLDDNIIMVINGKETIDRLVPFGETIGKLCRKYFDEVAMLKKQEDYFFSIHNKGRMAESTITSYFHKSLKVANIQKIPHIGPRMQDFRFTFVVNSIQRFIDEGKDINVYLPILQRYLGHSNLDDTLYYYRPKERLYPTIAKQCEDDDEIIPNIKEIEFDEE